MYMKVGEKHKYTVPKWLIKLTHNEYRKLFLYKESCLMHKSIHASCTKKIMFSTLLRVGNLLMSMHDLLISILSKNYLT